MKSNFTGILLIVALLFVALIGPAGAFAQEDDCAFADETIRIGATGPLSAPGAVGGGIAMQWAYNIAEADINSAPTCGIEIDGVNYPVEVIFADTEGLPERGVAVAERLINENNVVAITGEYHSAVGLAMMEVTSETNTPTVFAETWSDAITASGMSNVFRIAPASTMVSRVTADWLASLGVESVVIISENTDYGIGAVESDTAFMEALGMNVEAIFVELGTEDFVPILSRIQAGDTPDAIRLNVTGETSYNVVQQMAELGIAPTEDTICIANQVAIQPEFWESAPDGNYCVFTKVGLSPALYNDLTRSVVDRYVGQFDSQAPSYVLESYDSLWILADAIEQAGSTDSDAIIAAIEETDLVLSQGRYYFEYTSSNPLPDDGSVDAYMWHQWPNPAVLMLQYFEQGQSSEDAAVVWPEVYQTHGTAYIAPGSTR